MTCHTPYCSVALAAPRPIEGCFADAASGATPPAVGPLLRLWRRLAVHRPRPTRLSPSTLSPDRLRDLGLLDGRGVPRRDPWRD